MRILYPIYIKWVIVLLVSPFFSASLCLGDEQTGIDSVSYCHESQLSSEFCVSESFSFGNLTEYIPQENPAKEIKQPLVESQLEQSPEEMLESVSTYIENHYKADPELREKLEFRLHRPRHRFFLIRGIVSVKSSIGRFFSWFWEKDKSYVRYENEHKEGSQEDKRMQVRSEWHTLLGWDAFHAYYKYKEAEKKIRDKCTFRIRGVKTSPSYENGQIRLTFIKKF